MFAFFSSSVCAMGGTSSNSRLFGTLAQSLNSALLGQIELNLDHNLAETDQLLRECEEALQRRPARPHRDLVFLAGMVPCQKHNPSIRIMQWNIVAQGVTMCISVSDILFFKDSLDKHKFISVYIFFLWLAKSLVFGWQWQKKTNVHGDNHLNCFAALGEGKDGFICCPLDALNWQERMYLILEEILTYRPDILCLQEVDHYYDTFQPIMASLGYHGTFLAKPWSPCLDVEQNNGPDGCVLFFRRSCFSLQATAHLRLSAMILPTNQVAIMQTLTCQVTGRRLCVAVTHLKACSGWERLRSAQGADFLQKLQRIISQDCIQCKALSGSIPLVVCGDFNAEPTEDVYRRFSSSPPQPELCIQAAELWQTDRASLYYLEDPPL